MIYIRYTFFILKRFFYRKERKGLRKVRKAMSIIMIRY